MKPDRLCKRQQIVLNPHSREQIAAAIYINR
jgi:hypothetical protein